MVINIANREIFPALPDASNDPYIVIVDTSGGVVDSTTPATPSDGDVIEYWRNGPNFAGVAPNAGQTINGTTDTFDINQDHGFIRLKWDQANTNWDYVGAAPVVGGGGSMTNAEVVAAVDADQGSNLWRGTGLIAMAHAGLY